MNFQRAPENTRIYQKIQDLTKKKKEHISARKYKRVPEVQKRIKITRNDQKLPEIIRKYQKHSENTIKYQKVKKV